MGEATLGLLVLLSVPVTFGLLILILRVLNRRSTPRDYVPPPPAQRKRISLPTDTGAGTGGIGGI